MVFERREYVLKLYDTELLHFSAGVSRYGNLYADIIEADEACAKRCPCPSRRTSTAMCFWNG